MPPRSPPRGANAGRSPAAAEAGIPALGTSYAAGSSFGDAVRCGDRRLAPARSVRRKMGVPASAAAGFARSGASGCGVRGARCVERSERGCVRLGGRRASPGGRASWGPAWRHGLHRLPSDGRGSAPAARRCAPSEGAPPAGQARFARVLRAAGARFTRRAASRLGCGACSLRSRSTGRRRPCGRGSALRAPPAEQGRFAPAPRAAGARFTRSALRASLRCRLASLAHRGARRTAQGRRPCRKRFPPLPARSCLGEIRSSLGSARPDQPPPDDPRLRPMNPRHGSGSP